MLPGEIVQDQTLTIAAKYLYIILSSMAHKNGFCWPSNEELASELGLSKRRTVELIGMLRDAGYIRITFQTFGKRERRYIYCGMFPDKEHDPVCDAEDDGCEEVHREDAVDRLPPCEESHRGDAVDCLPPCEESHGPHAKNTLSISSRKTNKKNKKNLPSQVTQRECEAKNSKYDLQEDARAILNAYVGKDRELAATMQDMISNRIELKATNSVRAIKAMLTELDRLSGGSRQNKMALLRRAIASGWKTVYPMRPNELPDKPLPTGVAGAAQSAAPLAPERFGWD